MTDNPSDKFGAPQESPDSPPPRAETEPAPRRPLFRRRRSLLCTLLSLPFLAGCMGVLGLTVLFHWPRVNVPVFYVTVRPAWLWFAGLLPFLLIGVFGLRKRWIAAGILLWIVGLCACDEVHRTLRPFSERARMRFAAAHMAFQSFVEQGGAPDSVPLRIVTWNVQGGRRGPAEAVEQLASLAPDIVFFQEYQWGGRQAVKKAIEEHPAFADYYLDDQDRLGILSRYPVAPLPREELVQYRGAVWQVEPLPGRRIVCINVHLRPLELRTQIVRGLSLATIREDIARMGNHLERLSDAVARYGAQAPLIVAGDFNVPPRYADLRRAVGGLQEAFEAGGRGWPCTVPANHGRVPFPVLRVDMVFLPEEAKVFYAAAAPSACSDHYPLIAEARVPLPPAPESAP